MCCLSLFKMAALTSVLNIAGRSARRATVLSFKGHLGLKRFSAKIILPSLSPISNGSQFDKQIHTSTVARKELFELPKNRNEGASHWAFERVVAVGLLVFIPAGVIVPHPLIDYGLAVMLPAHAYWGVNAIIADYLWRPLVPVTKALWLVASLLAGAGFLYLNVYDVGVCKFAASIFNL